LGRHDFQGCFEKKIIFTDLFSLMLLRTVLKKIILLTFFPDATQDSFEKDNFTDLFP
jgi:hypothetical protein